MLPRLSLIFICCLLLSSTAQAQPADPPPLPDPEEADTQTAADTTNGEDTIKPPETPEPALPNAGLPEPSRLPNTENAFDPPPGDISIEDWNRDDWMLIKPAVSLFGLHGYFRIRGDMFRRLDFDNASPYERPIDATEDSTNGPRYQDGKANYQSTNLRLRLEPEINVTDKIQIVATIDVLDNLVLGSTPDSVPPLGTGTPVNILSRSQNVPQDMVNALSDSILVRRAYARMSALNEQLVLTVGRMPNHWGLGMMTNDGDCLDCDYGDVTDRIALTFRAAGHLFSPMFDWVSTGPMITPFGRSGGQPIDATDDDDVDQYSLRIERTDHPQDARAKVERGDLVLNYGLWNIFRMQSKEIQADWYQNYDPAKAVSTTKNHDGFIYTVDGYGTLQWRGFELAIEAALVYGNFEETLGSEDNEYISNTDVYKLGGAFEGRWQMPGQRAGSRVSLMAGGATGDSMTGFGALDRADTQRDASDRKLQNFMFSPDYHVDLLMFRRIVGTVTGAWYVRPGVTYMFDEKFAGKINASYSQAIFRQYKGGSLPMGIEFDAELSYGLESLNAGPLGGSLVGGIAFPLGAFDNPELETDAQGGSFAWTIQARMYLTF